VTGNPVTDVTITLLAVLGFTILIVQEYVNMNMKDRRKGRRK